MRTAVLGLLLTVSVLTISANAGGQDAAGVRFEGRAGAMAVGAVTTANPAMLGERYTEGYLTQPNLMGDARVGALRFTGTLNFEGYTLRRGELNAGMYGEGYVDRRHPHSFVHEAMLSLVSPAVRGVRASLSAGKGFTPYGTDDPMMRPFVKYPVNHHHAQIIERALVVGALGFGDAVVGRGAALEYGVFNGDEPYAPFTAPRWSRVGDSRSARLTVRPHRTVEVQASRAFVKSPGIVQGGAFDHTQSSASVRYDREPGSHVHTASAPTGHDAHAEHGASHGTSTMPRLLYAMAEFARTDEGDENARAFRYESTLAEAMLGWRGATLALRGERTERPEGERLLDPFRTAAGHIDFQIIGVTRWQIATVALSSPPVRFPSLRGTGRLGLQFVPFAEFSRAAADAVLRPTVFEPRDVYGSRVQWSITAGLRVHAGSMRPRMGRYGVLAPRW